MIDVGASPASPAAPDSPQAILRARAAALAAEPTPAVPSAQVIQVVEFQLASETYAVESQWVKEVCPLKDLTPVPCTPAFVFGIVNVRGQILSVIDLRSFFDLPFNGLTNLNKAIILGDGQIAFGILADAINGVRSLPTDSLQTSLPTLKGIREKYLRGVTGDRVVVIDAAKLMAAQDIVVNEQVESAA